MSKLASMKKHRCKVLLLLEPNIISSHCKEVHCANAKELFMFHHVVHQFHVMHNEDLYQLTQKIAFFFNKTTTGKSNKSF